MRFYRKCYIIAIFTVCDNKMKIGTKDIPESRFSLKLITDLKTIFERFDKNEVDIPTVSALLGHKSPTSGTFLYKIASLRAFGLVEGRGNIVVTDIGEKIAFKQDDISYNQAIINAVTRVPLWDILFNKYNKNHKEIKEEDFWTDLKEYCDLTIDEARKRSQEILKYYREDTKLINMNLVNMVTQRSVDPAEIGNIPLQSSSSDVMDIGYKNYKVYLPKDEDEQKEVWKRLKGMVEAYLNPKE